MFKRKHLISSGIAAITAFLVYGCAAFPSSETSHSITLVHLTDTHIRHMHEAPQRFHFALQAIRKNYPTLIINTGDTMDAPNNATVSWPVWHDGVDAELAGILLYSLLGNHDFESKSGMDIAIKELGMPSRYYSFDHSGWHFIMLDGNGFHNDTVQCEWLTKELKNTPVSTPIAIASHHPIFSMSAMVNSPGDYIGKWKDLIALFNGHPNVKLCLSGHPHLADVSRYNGVTYACGGAASGYWWEIEKSDDGKGSYRQTPPGYNLIKLSPTGGVSVEYRGYPDPILKR